MQNNGKLWRQKKKKKKKKKKKIRSDQWHFFDKHNLIKWIINSLIFSLLYLYLRPLLAQQIRFSAWQYGVKGSIPTAERLAISLLLVLVKRPSNWNVGSTPYSLAVAPVDVYPFLSSPFVVRIVFFVLLLGFAAFSVFGCFIFDFFYNQVKKKQMTKKKKKGANSVPPVQTSNFPCSSI